MSKGTNGAGRWTLVLVILSISAAMPVASGGPPNNAGGSTPPALVDLRRLREVSVGTATGGEGPLDVVLAMESDRKDELFAGLLELTKSDDPRVRATACHVLGVYRFSEAVPRLTELISETLAFRISKEPHLLADAAAEEALVRIGDRKVSAAMVRLLSTSSDEVVRGRAVDVLHRVEGSGIAAVILSNARQGTAEGSDTRANLNKAVESLAAIPQQSGAK